MGRYPPREHGEPYRWYVPAVDADGNEKAGIALPDIAVPVAPTPDGRPGPRRPGGRGRTGTCWATPSPSPRTLPPGAAGRTPALHRRALRERETYLSRVARRPADWCRPGTFWPRTKPWWCATPAPATTPSPGRRQRRTERPSRRRAPRSTDPWENRRQEWRSGSGSTLRCASPTGSSGSWCRKRRPGLPQRLDAIRGHQPGRLPRLRLVGAAPSLGTGISVVPVAHWTAPRWRRQRAPSGS